MKNRSNPGFNNPEWSTVSVYAEGCHIPGHLSFLWDCRL